MWMSLCHIAKLSVSLSLSWSLCLAGCLCLFVCLFVFLPYFLPSFLWIHMSVCLSVSLPLCLYALAYPVSVYFSPLNYLCIFDAPYLWLIYGLSFVCGVLNYFSYDIRQSSERFSTACCLPLGGSPTEGWYVRGPFVAVVNAILLKT